MDYQNELKNIQEGSNYWKPKAGQFKVKSLTELEPTNPFIKKSKDDTGKDVEEVHEQVKVSLLVNGETKIWTFGKGKTPASTYGQLVELAVKHGNKLQDLEFTIVVKNDGTKNDYTIV
jgi:DNA-binding protein H-NS